MYRPSPTPKPLAAIHRQMRDTTEGGSTTPRLCAQGDILIERIDTTLPANEAVGQAVRSGSVVIAEGEATGHRHRLLGTVTMFRDDALARDIPRGLYVAHVRIEGPTAWLVHEEHAPIALPRGTYRIRRQRSFAPTDVGLEDDVSVIGD